MTHKLVPLEPTEAMIGAGRGLGPVVFEPRKIGRPYARTLLAEEVRDVYAAMLAAAPEPPADDAVLEAGRVILGLRTELVASQDAVRGLVEALERIKNAGLYEVEPHLRAVASEALDAFRAHPQVSKPIREDQA